MSAILPEGDYRFKVMDLTRTWFRGSDKTPPCNKAVVTLSVCYQDRFYYIKQSFILHRNFEWLLSRFFQSIGKKKPGERYEMDWDCIVDCVGTAHFKPRTFTGNDGHERECNGVAYFINYDPRNSESDMMNGINEKPLRLDQNQSSYKEVSEEHSSFVNDTIVPF